MKRPGRPWIIYIIIMPDIESMKMIMIKIRHDDDGMSKRVICLYASHMVIIINI